MEKIIVKIVYTLVSKLLERNVVSSIKELIILYSKGTEAGIDKKKAVTEDLYKTVSLSIGETASYIVSMVIDITYAYLKVNQEVK